MRKAYLIVGPESSGTRVMTQIFVEGGCFGDFSHKQRLDNPGHFGNDVIVWRRSFPYSGQWPSLEAIVRNLAIYNYEVYVVVMTRDMYATAQSQMHTWGRNYEEAINSIRTSYALIFSDLIKVNVPFIVVSYESMVQRGLDGLKNLFHLIDFEPPDHFEFYDGNKKWLDYEQ